MPFAAAGVGAPHIRERAYWVANVISEYESAAGDKTGPATRLRSCETNQLADASGERFYRFDSLLQREESGRIAESVPKTTGHCFAGGMGDANDSRLEGLFRDDGTAGGKGTTRSVASPGLHGTPLEINGFWRDADWLFCRDGQWRPVESGTFLLVARFAKSLGHGKSSLRAMAGRNRTGRLCVYGNAINAQTAAEFIRAYISISEAA